MTKQSRAERRAQRASPSRIELWENTDPLETYDCNKRLFMSGNYPDKYNPEIVERLQAGQSHLDISRITHEPLDEVRRVASIVVGHPFRDLWRGKAAFLVGSGPSLNTIDYMRLGERGICSLGINNSAAMVPVSAMTFADPPEKFSHGIFFDPKITKFVPLPKMGKRVRAKLPSGEFRFTAYEVRQCPSVVGIKRLGYFEPEEYLRQDGCSWGTCAEGVSLTKRPKCIFTFFIALRLLHYLGAKRVFLAGVDFRMPFAGCSLGNYAFRESGSQNGNHDHYRVATEMLRELLPVFEAADFQIYQTNPDSQLTLFPHVPFEEALEVCRAPVPPGELDVYGFYRCKGNGFAPPESID